ncbi:MAG: 4-hydroxy-tetrahydrodipicolinate synthase [Bacteroidales bacterium]|jgi:4-hydroxy-tetrahydrodipicolinate synthase|nr:4-hydroxy-tetrahydrodipicolinate synthase [Bacteroidales bacterium]
MIQFKGCGTALFTPFKNGKVDLDCFGRCVRRQVEGGIDFLIPLGTTGETPTLSDEEKVAVYRCARENAGGLPVVVGVGTNSVAGTVANIRLLHEADAFLVVAPYYNKPPQRGMYEYFKAVAGETDKPIILYNVPGRTSSNIEAETTLRLATDVANIVAVKEASGKIPQIEEILKGAPKGFAVLSGNDDDTFELMKKGAAGVVSVASNVAPKMMADFTRALQDGRYEEAAKMNEALSPLFKNLFIEPNPIPGKAAMALLGLMENSLRLPLVSALPETEKIMAQTLKDLNLL